MTNPKEQPHSFESEWEKMKDKFACDVASEYSDVVPEQQDCRWHVLEGVNFIEQNMDKHPKVSGLLKALEHYAQRMGDGRTAREAIKKFKEEK